MRRARLSYLALAALLCVALCCAGRASAVTTIRAKYGGGASRSVVAYLPARSSARPRPAVLFLHSHAGGRLEFAPAAETIAREGAIGVLVDYDIDALWPAQPKQTRAAYRFVRAHRFAWNLEAKRIAIVGASQGATLALQLGFGRYAASPLAVVSWSGVSDFAQVPAIVGSEMGCALADCPDSWTAASAALLPPAPSLRSVQVVNGTHEYVPASQARGLDAHAAALGLDHELTLWPCTCHGVAYAPGQWELTDAFLRAELGF